MSIPSAGAYRWAWEHEARPPSHSEKRTANRRVSNAANAKYDLTRGSILNRLLLVALPIIGTQLILMGYNLTDMFLLGRVGSDAVAASGSAGMYLWLSNGLMLLGRMGAEIGVSQNMGCGDMATARRFSQDSMTLSVVMGLSFALLCILFNGRLIGFFNIREASVVADAERYLLITALGMPANFVCAAVIGTFNGSGNSRVPFFVISTGLLMNAALDPLFIFVFGMGVAGAAVATVISMYAACALLLRALLKREDRPFERYRFFPRPDFERIARILKWSVPIGAESLLFTVLIMLISRLVADFGARAIAVYRVGTQIESLCWLICIGFSTAITAFVGQNFGAEKWDRVRACFSIAILTVCSWGAIVTVVLIAFGGALFRFFLPEPELVAIGGTFLLILAASQIPGCLEAVGSGVFRGLGKTLPPSIASIVSNSLRVPLAYALSRQMGLTGIWLAISLGGAFRGVWVFVWFLRELRSTPKGEGGEAQNSL